MTIRNVFISSKYRLNQSENPYDFNIYLPSGFIMCNENQDISVNIINFHMPNTMYNINDNNNTFQLILRDKITEEFVSNSTYTLTNGNYNVYELRDHINSLCSGYLSLSYDSKRNKYTFTDVFNDVNSYIYLKASNGKYLGLLDDVEYILDTPKESVKPINMVAYNKIVMNIQGMEYSGLGIENISSFDGFEISNIFFWASRQDVNNMAEIQYNNEDGGNSFNYQLFNKSVQNLRFMITDEDYNQITDCPDWTMILQFSITDRHQDQILSILSVIQRYLLDIYSMLYLILDKWKILS